MNTTENQDNTGEYKMINAYMSSWEHLEDELKRLDLLLRLYITRQEQFGEKNSYTGMELTAEEVFSMLEGDSTDELDKSILENKLAKLDNKISKRLEASLLKGIHLSIPYISKLLNLSPLEERCIIICLAPEVNRKYAKLYGCFQDDISIKSPSICLVLQMLTKTEEEKIAVRHLFDMQAPLVRFLMEFQNDLMDMSIPLITRQLKLDDWVVNFLLDIEVLDTRLVHVAEMVTAGGQKEGSMLTTVEENIIRFIDYYQHSKEYKLKQIFYFYGPNGVGKRKHVLTVCNYLNLPLIIVDIENMLASDTPLSELLRRLGRQIMIGNTALCLENFDRLLEENGINKQKLNSVLQMIEVYSPITFILGQFKWSPLLSDTKITFVGVEFPFPTEIERKVYWEKFSQNYKLAKTVDLDNFSGNFRFTPVQIQTALSLGENISVWNGAVNGLIGSEELSNACYTQSNRKLSALASKIKKTYTWNMLVLPSDQMSQMKEICNQVKFRATVYEKWGFEQRLSLGKGLNVLFSGPPGSGKTMAAEVIANELCLEIYKIDVSQVVSKYIGETEKNLSLIFAEAETSNAILFFDEADALFGKRSEVKDAHDRYANVEISYLLQKMEEYEGIVILATNLNQNIDDAFLRRLHFNIAFPFPEKEQRKLIWQGMFPADAPVDSALDYDFLAEKFILAGGNIKNIALNAAFYAAHDLCSIGIKQIMLSAKREYKKMGKTFLKSDFDPYYQLIEVMK